VRVYLPLALVLLVAACSEAGASADALEEAAAERRLGELAAGASPSRAPVTAGALLGGVQVYGQGAGSERARVVLELTGDAPFRRRERPAAAGQARALVFDFEAQLAPGLAPFMTIGSAGLERIALDAEPGVATVLVELAPTARYQLFVMDEPRRIVIDVESGLAAEAEGAPLVLLDPGHGGEDYGSPGPFGLWEGQLTLDISRRVRSWLAHLVPGVRVRMTRDSDVYLSLEERAAMANSLGADLFVSVHLNAATTTVDHGGVATYVLDVNNDRNVLRLAARENGSSTGQVSPLQFLVGSLARGEQRTRSEALAGLIQRGTLVSARRFLPSLADRGVKSAMFYVLVGAQMPAVLVEGSFITQPEEAAQLTTPGYRDALAEGMARGIARYLQDN
jgi:N-acetylmuramoyl-L-alanine amidase